MLPDLEALRVEAGDAEARAAAATARAVDESQAARTAEQRGQALATELASLDRRRQEYETLVIEGRAARQELDTANRMVAEQQAELDTLVAAADQLAGLVGRAGGLDTVDAELEAMAAAVGAAAALERISVPPEPPPVDENAVAEVRAAAAGAGRRLAELSALARAAGGSLDVAQEAADRTAVLDGDADCPVCGQALGAAFEQVRAHRAAELSATKQRFAELSAEATAVEQLAHDVDIQLAELLAGAEAGRQARRDWDVLASRAQQASAALRAAWGVVLAVAPGRATDDGSPPAAGVLNAQLGGLRRQIQRQRDAAAEADRLRARLERRPAVEASLETYRERADHADGRVRTLREKVRDLGFDQVALQRVAAAHSEATTVAEAARQREQQAAVEAARQQAEHEAAARRWADGEDQHARLAELEAESRHLARVADLLTEFRNTVVASVGPRLALQAADLFADLTDHEYDELQVDPDTYQLQVRDNGRVYGLDRFSGSEIDLANLALRVAISEHIHFQSGGSVGLMVLDEVFGPLDEDRKARMLQALERLRSRFRQVLVVTHDASIKEQLPNAIEVIKLPGRRARAQAVAAYAD
jgi:DNA repair exonuclease SbcCD ATPase subunit